MRRVLVTMVCGLGVGLVMPVAARADGNPVGPVLGGAGVSVPGGAVNDVAVTAGRNTVVEQIHRNGGAVQTFNLLRGDYGVPGVGYSGNGTGLSADGSTLVLESVPNTARPHGTTLAVLAGGDLRVLQHISLPGYFTVDAVSPTGRWLYLTHYRSFSNISHYEVRAYDLSYRKLLARPIVDPRQPGEKMQGTPMTRVVSADGRWDYTLYYRGNEAPFIHALDTTGRRAFCIDLPKSLNKRIGAFQLTLRSGALQIMDATTAVAVVNTHTFTVRQASTGSQVAPVRPAGRAAVAGAVPSRKHDRFPWLPVAVGLAAAVAAGLLAGRHRRGHAVPSPAPPPVGSPALPRR